MSLTVLAREEKLIDRLLQIRVMINEVERAIIRSGRQQPPDRYHRDYRPGTGG